MNGRRIYHARGKVLGGSSSVNGMIFQRGNPMDYEKWGQLPGMEKWNWYVLPYFNKMETALGADPRIHAVATTATKTDPWRYQPTFPGFLPFGSRSRLQPDQ